MNIDIVCKSSKANDEYYTPLYAIYPLLEFLPSGSNILCPFDTKKSYFVKLFKKEGFNVDYSHITPEMLGGGNKKDFFTYTKQEVEKYDYIISNPPFSFKNELFFKLFSLNKPFAMLFNIIGLFETKRFNAFENENFQLLVFNKRVEYFKDYATEKTHRIPYSSFYVCKNFLKEDITLRRLDTSNNQLNKLI